MCGWIEVNGWFKLSGWYVFIDEIELLSKCDEQIGVNVFNCRINESLLISSRCLLSDRSFIYGRCVSIYSYTYIHTNIYP